MNSFATDEDWHSILTTFKEDSSHFERVKYSYDLILKIYNLTKIKRTSIISNSLIIFHKYYIYTFFTNSSILIALNEDNDNNKNLAYISLACFFISLKTSNYLFPCQFIIDSFCNIQKIENDEEKIKIRKKVLFYESDIFFSINFSMEYKLPYPFLKNLLGIGDGAVLKYIIKNSNKNTNINNILAKIDNDENKIKCIKNTISEIVNYSFLFPFFLNYNSEIISFSCLKLALARLNSQINIKDIINIIDNYQKETKFVSIDVNDINDIEICSSLIDELVLSKICLTHPQETYNINNINIHNNFLNVNAHYAQYNTETKPKDELKEKTKIETLLKRKRK